MNNTTTQEAITHAARGANKEWLAAARKALMQVAKKQKRLTAADVAEQMVKAAPVVSTPERRAMGAVMLWASKQGHITALPEVTRDTRKWCHDQLIRVWESNVCAK